MKSLAMVALGLVGWSYAQASSPLLVIENQLISSPGGVNADAPHLTGTVGGAVFLSWIEPGRDEIPRAMISQWDPANLQWSSFRIIARGTAATRLEHLTLSAISDSTLLAAWSVSGQKDSRPTQMHSVFSVSENGGESWSPASPLTSEKTESKLTALGTLPHGHALATWVSPDDRDPTKWHLASRILFLATEPPSEKLIAANVASNRPSALISFPDGRALVAYQGESGSGIGDFRTAEFKDGNWSTPRMLDPGTGMSKPESSSGPSLAAVGGRVSAVWIGMIENHPQLLYSSSPDAGGRFLLPVRIDDGHPIGQPSVALLHDGTAIAAWVEEAPSADVSTLWIRRILPSGELSVPVRIAPHPHCRTPSLAVLGEPENEPARLLLAGAYGTDVTQIFTRLIILQPPSADGASNPCARCPPAESSLRGQAIRGRIQSLGTAHPTVLLRHRGIAGTLSPGITEFYLAPDELESLQKNVEIVARAEERGGKWWLFDVRLIVPLSDAAP